MLPPSLLRQRGGFLCSQRCDCRQPLEMALSLIAQAGVRVLLYKMQEGHGFGPWPRSCLVLRRDATQ
ncbi:MAG TPA: hypothetical protein VLA83_07340 [Candidatus Binatia bacterium]|nr:hypothetical protein [Candidatus Binatia bacterium]